MEETNDQVAWLANQVLFCYEAGQVRRWHTQGHIIREDNVAAHSWGVLMWIALLHPAPSPLLLRVAAMHDIPEYLTGDIPRWTKQANPALKGLLDGLEQKVAEEWKLPTEEDLTPGERRWLKGADLLDAWLFIRQNMLAGNQHMKPSYWKALKDFENIGVPPEIERVYKHIHTSTAGAEP